MSCSIPLLLLIVLSETAALDGNISTVISPGRFTNETTLTKNVYKSSGIDTNVRTTSEITSKISQVLSKVPKSPEVITTGSLSKDTDVTTGGSKKSEESVARTTSGDVRLTTGDSENSGVTTESTPSEVAKISTDGSENFEVTATENTEASPHDAKSFEESINDKLEDILKELDDVNAKRIVCNISIGIGEENYKTENVRRELIDAVYVQIATDGERTQKVVVQVPAEQFEQCLAAALQDSPEDTAAANLACLTQAVMMYEPDINEGTLKHDQELLSFLGQGAHSRRREARNQHGVSAAVEGSSLPELVRTAASRDHSDRAEETHLGVQTRTNPEPQANLRVRKEYRALSEDERSRFHAAMETLFKNGTVASFGRVHSQTSLTAHRGAAFLPWHRIFITKFEDALREVDASVTLPYWDCTLDRAMQNPTESRLWSEQLLGNMAGDVNSGFAAGWTSARHALHRQCGDTAQLPSKQHFITLMTKCHLQDVSYPEGGFTTFEQLHNDVHAWVGGDMSDVGTAAYDPAFYLMHAFFDYKWEEFRSHQRADCGVDPATDYPSHKKRYKGQKSEVVDGMRKRSFHGGEDLMDGMPDFTNRDGIADTWTTHVFTYAPSPSCADNCAHSDLLYCDMTRNICVAKPRPQSRPVTRTHAPTHVNHHEQTRVLSEQQHTQVSKEQQKN